MATVSPQPINLAAVNTKAAKVISLVIKFFALFPLLMGFVFLCIAAYSGYSRFDVLKHWPSVDAVVTQSRLEHHQETMNDKNGSHTTTVYTPQIELRYTLNGKEYTTPARAGYSSSNYAEMKQKVDNYAPGTHHAIRYNPANLNDIRYDVAATFDYFTLPVVMGGAGLVAFLIGLGLFTVGRKIGNVKVRCPSCGAMVSASEGNCPLCGASLFPTPSQTDPNAPTPGT
jgi:Protein of unknown function (DUF3592)